MSQPNQDVLPMIRPVPYMGVIWVTHKAREYGFIPGDKTWCNLGQGEPEEGPIDGAPERLNEIQLKKKDLGYGPVGGTWGARGAVAQMYNRIYRVGKSSQYGPDNVTFASGGRVALSRLFNIFGDEARILYRNPDYTAYEDLLYYQRLHTELICEETQEQGGFMLTPDRLSELVRTKSVNAYVFSNPNNPTGSLVAGEDLKRYCSIAREHHVFLAIDEFYSHYVYDKAGNAASGPLSAARYVEDVETDPVVLIDGLTKNHRYPGFRVSWVVGPSHVIEAINRVASALDGGPSMPAMRAAREALLPERFDAETSAVRRHFADKRRYMLERLIAMGIRVPVVPNGAFYIWGDISGLPQSINEGDAFCFACLKKKVMTVPGRFFDIRPHRDRISPEPMRYWMRFSYGPSMSVLKEGLDRMQAVIEEFGRIRGELIPLPDSRGA